MTGHEVRARPPSGRPDGSPDVTVRHELTTQGFRAGPGFAMFGAGGAALRCRGGRWRLKDWRLRTKLTAVLLVPLLLAGVLGALRVTDLVRRAQGFAALNSQFRFAQQLGVVVYELQGERTRVAVMQADGGTADRVGIPAQAARVDSAVSTLRAAQSAGEVSPAAALSRLSGLPAVRKAALRTNLAPGSAAARDAVVSYSALITALLELDRRALGGAPDSLGRRADGVKVLAVAQEQAAYQHAALLAGILSGGLLADQLTKLRTADGLFDAAAEEFGQTVSPEQGQLYFGATAVRDRKLLLSAALDRAQRAAPLETVAGDWNSAAVGTVEDIRQGQITLLSGLRKDTAERSDQAWREAFWDGAAVIALLLLAVALLVVVVRSLLQPLRALRTAAFEVADRRLPEAAEQLRGADCGPGQTTVDPVPVHSREEVGQVARAFDTVHAQAVRLAAEQAQLRSSLNDVFVNLSGRSQRLVQRQLQLIDEMRSQTHDPAMVTNLVALDRMAARMRRHSENLMVLAGGTVRRGAEGPVAVSDVLDSAVSEIDQYQRVTVCPSPPAMVAAPIANDLVHLLAELLDNATGAAPEDTTVTLAGALTEDKSLLVEITDSGPGIALDELQGINARLACASAVDVSVPGPMGLFVVRELAAQHGISVRVRQRLGGGGITATVLLPPSLVTVDLRVPMDRVPDSPSEPGTGSPGWSWSEGELPLQVSVIDEATEGELFSPASVNPASLGAVTSQRSQPLTAQQEWLELFGDRDPAGGWVDHPQAAAATDALDSASPPSISAPPAGSGAVGHEEVREEIFEMVSAWFRERQSAPATDAPSTAATEWWSPFDEGWQSAQALRAPVDHDLTTAGLPKRQPRAHLVSGADGGGSPTPVSAAPARTPDAVRGRLSRYQRGLNVGRHAHIGLDEQLTWTDTLPRLFDERTSEENP
ncbi:MAG: nitrate- and nitrite sensing domain-containing protein [Actinomycetota bacterium]|nr:nitrate- and nitrite sensing domain-containing protein [Actinomycetota bacterium]